MLSNASRAVRSSTPKGYAGYARVGQRAFGRSSLSLSPQPNAPIPLDPSMQALLRDVDISLLNHKPRTQPEPRELEAFPIAAEEQAFEEEVAELDSDTHRKSPAALFGSRRIGAVVVPKQLCSAVTSLIEASDKSQLHSDAVRLFANPEGDKPGWQLQLDTKYRSYKQGARHAERDATAFASIALPGHYSAIYSVFNHLKLRMPSDWEVERVIDWGSGTYAGLWASLFSFQRLPEKSVDMDELDAAHSTVQKYLGIDRRTGLVAIGDRLLKDIPVSPTLSVQHRKTLAEEDNLPREDGQKTVALTAFTLSSLALPLARKQLVKEMWESGAHTMILIDHDSKSGFEAIAQAREYLLKLGQKEQENLELESSSIRGSHVVAPCPHDGACPLFHSGSSRLVCGFSQRMQRPAFVRLTKHSKLGHEDVQFSYVVIQRGPRPTQMNSNAGRVGLVGLRDVQERIVKATPVKQLSLFEEGAAQPLASPKSPLAPESAPQALLKVSNSEELTAGELETVLRQEAYHWPRLVFPPMKKSGHVILDSCTPEGKIMRLTIPKSQGKQPYYDARKSSWGDLFPHPPKNAPQERVVVKGSSGKVKSVQRDHIGKSQGEKPHRSSTSMFDKVATSVREAKKEKRRWDKFMKKEQVWNVDS